MQEFQYKYGDKPLEGYIIQRAAGRGGFGEVYYAVSDSGRQVALKVIQNYEQTELRGISQCMNLKSPHLVTIFDVKYNAEEKPFVIMEYVSGPSLRDMLNDAPSGMGEQKTAFFLREIAKGLSYLHECGIVHRDLKPGNIFYENGYVKIGDYGLSKLINTGRHSQQTITVGTVNYMAPEIGAGCYDRSVDIYALGILLYEMLTGQVPFFGSSPAEVLMKHMTAKPDLRNISEPFKRAITKALTKDPKERYRNVQEMVEDVFGAEHVRNSISQFSPDSLSVYADQVAKKVKGASPETAQQKAKTNDSWEKIGRQIGSVGDRWTEKVRNRFARPRPHGRRAPAVAVDPAVAAEFDPITRQERRVLAFFTAIVISLGVALIGAGDSDAWQILFGLSFSMILGAAGGVLLASRRLPKNLEKSSLRNIMAAAAGIILAAFFSMIFWSEGPGDIEHLAKGTFIALVVVIGFINWWKITSPLRKERVVLGRVIWLSCLGFVAAQMFHGHSVLVIGVLAGTLLVVQIACPFVPKAARDGFKKRKHSQETAGGLHNRPSNVPPPQPGMDMVSPVPSNVIGPRYSEPFNIVSFLFSWVGTTFLLLAFLVGLALALHVPAVIAAGIPDPGLARELDKLFGGPGWPGILDKMGFVVATILFLLAMTFTIIARRRSGGAHIIRAGVGMLGLALFLSVLSEAFPKSYPKTLYHAFENNQVGPAFETMFGYVGNDTGFGAAVLFAVSIIILCWPPKRREYPFVLAQSEESTLTETPKKNEKGQ